MSESGEDGAGGAGPDQRPDVGGAGSGGSSPAPRSSGLRNPEAAIRGVGAAALGAQGVVLLLAIVPLRVLGAGGNLGTVGVVALAVASFALAGLLRHRWAWWAGGALPFVIIGFGIVVHPAIIAAGVLSGLVWLYVLRVRKTVLGSPRS